MSEQFEFEDLDFDGKAQKPTEVKKSMKKEKNNKKEKKINYFIDVEDEFIWMNFEEKYRNIEFKSMDEATNELRNQIKRVCAKICLGGTNLYIYKSSSDDPYRIDKKCPSLKVAVSKTQESDGEIKVSRKKWDIKDLVESTIPLYCSLVFKPLGYEMKKGEFNIWSGFRGKSLEEVDMSKIVPMLEHIKEVWANNDEVLYKYIISWFATIIQTPYKKTSTMIILKGEQGCGKNIVIEFIIKYVLGNRLCYSTAGLESITSKFNNFMKGKLLVVVNEASSLDKKFHANFDIMKNRITEPTVSIEPKGIDSYEIDNFANFIMTTNNDFTVKIESGDRRYLCLDCNNKYSTLKSEGKSNSHFTKIIEMMNEECGNHFFTYLNNYKDIVDCRNIPTTQLKKDMADSSLSTPKRFLKDILDGEIVFDENQDDKIMAADLYKSYTCWCKEGNMKMMSSIIFGSDIKNNIEKKKISKGFVYNLKTINIDKL